MRVPGLLPTALLHVGPDLVLGDLQHPLDDVGGAGDDVLDVIFADLEVKLLKDLLCMQGGVLLRVAQLLNLVLEAVEET